MTKEQKLEDRGWYETGNTYDKKTGDLLDPKGKILKTKKELDALTDSQRRKVPNTDTIFHWEERVYWANRSKTQMTDEVKQWTIKRDYEKNPRFKAER